VIERNAGLEIRVRGVVQGVGFRPFVQRLALRMGLSGWVRNEAGTVRVRAQGPKESLDRFLQALRAEAPPLARIEELEVREAASEPEAGFRVLPSDLEEKGRLPVSPDVSVCPQCLADLLDPLNRRYRYPFITCTDCGPRFTVIEGMPYDRERTSMSAFSQCPDCEEEYLDPKDRRCHSETNSCPACGPAIWYEGVDPRKFGPGFKAEEAAEGTGDWTEIREEGDQALKAAGRLLRAGGILALRGLGGFHLAVDATNDGAVKRLRERKGREEKPLAIMVRGLEGAKEVGKLSGEEERLLTSPERPIVLLPEQDPSPLAPSISPNLARVGVMIPYTPLHYLLLEEVATPLVMTSGNLSEEPIAARNWEARDRLGPLVDGFLFHDREIVARCDDSVVQVVDGVTLIHRRARGFAPLPLPLPLLSPKTLLAVGPHLKNTFALVHGREVYVSQHIGDLETVETLGHFKEAVNRFRRLFRIDPEVVVRDLHPGYLSTRLAHEFARTLGLGEVMAVQHHHAHLAAVLAERGEVGPAVGLAFDGTGYGDDGCVWGGEILVADLESYRRAGRMRYAPLPGGETAVRNPWRTALGYLSLEPGCEEDFQLAFSDVPSRDLEVVARQAETGFNAPLASSMGRLFDAAAAVLGLRRRSSYEGQAAMELEAAAGLDGGGAAEALILPFPVEKDPEGTHVMDPLPLLSAMGRLRRTGSPLNALARAFHGAVARTSAGLAEEVCGAEGLNTVVLSGGVFQNALLLQMIREKLEKKGLRVLVPEALGPNDGAISYGQAAVAAARMLSEDGGRTRAGGGDTAFDLAAPESEERGL
jgi:hydrogenase maturation protein HypF